MPLWLEQAVSHIRYGSATSHNFAHHWLYKSVLPPTLISSTNIDSSSISPRDIHLSAAAQRIHSMNH